MDIFVLFTLPVLMLTAKNLAQTVCIFIGILLFHRHFLKKYIFCIRYKKYSQHLLDKNVPIETH